MIERIHGLKCFLGAVLVTLFAMPTVARAECRADSECKGSRVCMKGACVEPPQRSSVGCSGDADCKGNRACQAGVCVDRCSVDTQCPGDEVCNANLCTLTQSCAADNECPGAWVCQAGSCAAPGSSAPIPPGHAVAAPPPEPVPAPPPAAEPVAPVSPEAPPVVASIDGGVPAPDEDDGRPGVTNLVSGLVLFGAVYALTIPLTAAASEDSPTGSATDLAAIPVFGPFVIIGEHEAGLTEEGVFFYVLDGALQLTGVVLAIVGGVEMGSARASNVSVVPSFNPQTGTAALTIGGALDL